MDYLGHSLKLAVRQLRRNPGYTVTVVVTLALAIGANTAMFSMVNALLLKRLPYPHPERVATIYARTTGTESLDFRRTIDGEQWELLRDEVPAVIPAVSALFATGMNLQAGSRVRYVQGGAVSAHYFDVLGIKPILGRNFSEREDLPHGPRAALLSYRLWRADFGGDRNLPGQSVELRGEPYTVVGVLPENALTPLNADVYTPLQPSPEGRGRSTNFVVILRLRPRASWQQADAEINRAWAGSRRKQFFDRSNPGAQIAYYCMPLHKAETSALRPQVLALLLAAGFILLIACANLAGLALVRMMRRTREIATRLALGASSGQIRRQLWVENLLLAAVGGVAGIGTGFAALRGMLLLLPEHFLPVAKVSLEGRVLGFTALLSLLASVLCGMLPALVTRKVDLRSAIGSRGVIGGGGIRLRQGLVAGEVALTVVLLAAAGLLVRTLIHLETLPPGFNPNGVMTAKASLDDVRYHDLAAFRKLLDQSLAAIRAIPGVENAAVGLTLPYERALLNAVTISDGSQAGRPVTTNEVYVTPGYFATLQIPVVAGRAFTAADGPDAQPVVVVNQAFARWFIGGANPVGRYLDKRILIVGEVADTVLSTRARLHEGAAPLAGQEMVYLPAAQIVDAGFLALVHEFFQPSWIVRTGGPVEGLSGQMQRAMASVDPRLPFSGFYNMEELMAMTLATQRFDVALLAAMAALGLLLSAVGIFALMANLVAQRTREIGIRMALGSTSHQAMIRIGRAGVGAAGLGLALGLMLGAGALRAMRSALYGVGVYDVPTLAGVVIVLVAVTLVATAIPALRVARIDPARSLREE